MQEEPGSQSASDKTRTQEGNSPDRHFVRLIALRRLIRAERVELRLDVDGRDVVCKRHDLVRVQLVPVLVREPVLGDRARAMP